MALRVIAVVDKIGTALDRLAKGVAPFHGNLDYYVVDVHPKRPSLEQLQKFEELAKTADIIDYQYFRTAEMLREKYDWLKKIPSVLTHNNPYSIHESNWSSYQAVVANNRSILADLQKIVTGRLEYITLAVDPYFWEFNTAKSSTAVDKPGYISEMSVIMVANRIEAKKGILPVAEACLKLNLKMYLVGNISDIDYFHKIMKTGVVEFAQDVPDEKLRELYYKAGIHVNNSVDNYESGTLPILEAIFCGVPVLTRNIGHVPDFANEKNLTINKAEPEDVEALAKVLHDMTSNKLALEKQRQEAWFAIKDKTFERRAYSYQKLYRELLDGEPVSVITPVAGKEDVTRKCLTAISQQTHKNIEMIVVDDGEEPQEEVIKNFASTVSIPVRYIYTGGQGYNLAKARNLGIIEATSDVLVFCDQRMIMQPDAIETFLKHLKPNHWLFGNKMANKREFVENFSCIYRNELMTLGMFNERITEYGGMSQEIRARAKRQGVNLQYIETAKAEPARKSSNRITKKYEILRMKTLLWKIGLL